MSTLAIDIGGTKFTIAVFSDTDEMVARETPGDRSRRWSRVARRADNVGHYRLEAPL